SRRPCSASGFGTPREEIARGRDVFLDLVLQLQDGRELSLLSQALEEEEPDAISVDVGREVEHVGLDGRPAFLVQRGPPADVRYAGDRTTEGADLDLGHVDAVGRGKLVLRLEIDRRNADLVADTVAPGHDAVDFVGAAEHSVGLPDGAPLEGPADARRGYG